MYHFFVEPGQIRMDEKRVTVVGSDVNHIKNVLRMKAGEEVSVNTGADDKEYRLGILELTEDYIECEIRFVKENEVELPASITLFQGLPKGDKMELIIQKAVELGASRIVPVETKRCVVKLEEKKKKSKTERWQAIAKAAAEQSKRAVIPTVAEPVPFGQALAMAKSMDARWIPYEMAEGMAYTREQIESVKPGMEIGIFIGPEGGFEEGEIEKAKEAGVLPITLGKRILRTETAGFTILSWLMYQLEGAQ